MVKIVVKQIVADQVLGEATDRRHGTQSLLLHLVLGRVPTLIAYKCSDAVWGDPPFSHLGSRL